MYALVRGLIDDVLMGPNIGPFTTFGLVIMIGLSALNVIARGDPDDIEQESD